MFNKFSKGVLFALLGTMAGASQLQAANWTYDAIQRSIWGESYDSGHEPADPWAQWEENAFKSLTEIPKFDESLKIDHSTNRIKLAAHGAQDEKYIKIGRRAAEHSIAIKEKLEDSDLDPNKLIKLDSISHEILSSIRDCLVIIHNRLENTQEKNDRIDICPVCRDLLEQPHETSAVSSPGCSHQYHKACLEEWIKDHPLCPTCRGDALPNTINNVIIFPPLYKDLLGYIKNYCSNEQLDELMVAADSLGINPLLNVCDRAFGFEATIGSVKALQALIAEERCGQRENIVRMILIALCKKSSIEFKDLSSEKIRTYSIQELQTLFEQSVNYKTGLQYIIEPLHKFIIRYATALKQKMERFNDNLLPAELMFPPNERLFF